MNENIKTIDMGAASAPLMENQYVKGLFVILSDNNKDTSGLTALINHVNGLEDFVKQAEEKISEMKSQLDAMKEIQSHPIKNTLQSTIKVLEAKISKIKQIIIELKSKIVDGCKNAVAAFKEKGIKALHRIASFFRIKSGLLSIGKSLDTSIKLDNKAIVKIEAFSKEYHKTGRALKNMGRVLIGKEPINTAKESGKLAKVASAPYKADKALLIGMRKTVNKMLAKLEQLEQSASVKRDASTETKKPSMMKRLNDNKERVKQKDLEKAVTVRAPKEHGMVV
jgi:hypothetical protein